MAICALVSNGRQILPAANDVGRGSSYRASARVLPPYGATSYMQDHHADTLLFVETGVVELMVDGFSHMLSAGQSARIGRGRVFAYRNSGADDARVHGAIGRDTPAGRAVRVTLEIAA